MTPPVALVTGAARGVGRGIALVVAEAGATVHLTDRESRHRRFSDLPGTVEDTAEQVNSRGGRGVAHVVDHLDDDAVAAAVARIGEQDGGIDLLVANAFDGNALPFHGGEFWTLSLRHWTNMIDAGVRSHYVTAWHAAPLLIARGGLAVLTGYGDPAGGVLGQHAVYDLAMTAISRLATSLDHDLRPHGATALCLSPGFTRTVRRPGRRPRRPPPGGPRPSAKDQLAV
jgi:NAD(P)-dependent dehydrogenase (short-subunit alcohol dehydrogenase family)